MKSYLKIPTAVLSFIVRACIVHRINNKNFFNEKEKTEKSTHFCRRPSTSTIGAFWLHYTPRTLARLYREYVADPNFVLRFLTRNLLFCRLCSCIHRSSATFRLSHGKPHLALPGNAGPEESHTPGVVLSQPSATGMDLPASDGTICSCVRATANSTPPAPFSCPPIHAFGSLRSNSATDMRYDMWP